MLFQFPIAVPVVDGSGHQISHKRTDTPFMKAFRITNPWHTESKYLESNPPNVFPDESLIFFPAISNWFNVSTCFHGQSLVVQQKKTFYGDVHLSSIYSFPFGGFLKWGYFQIIHFSRIIHYKPSILRYPHGHGKPHKNSARECVYLGGFGVKKTWINCLLPVPGPAV